MMTVRAFSGLSSHTRHLGIRSVSFVALGLCHFRSVPLFVFQRVFTMSVNLFPVWCSNPGGGQEKCFLLTL